MKALPGAVTLMLGNHDAGLVQSDIDGLCDSVGKLRFVADEHHVVEGRSGARTVFAHGHFSTMFNAPGETPQWNALPIGHFVTRAFAHQMSNELKSGETVADRKEMGAPNGLDLTKLVGLWKEGKAPTNVAEALLDYVTEVAGLKDDVKIKLADGSETTIIQAKAAYKDLFKRWTLREGSEYNAWRAAMADQWGAYLAWSAQRLAIRQNASLVVLGHTHTAVGGLIVSPVNYLNSGFECPSKPDLLKKPFSFAYVDLESASGDLRQVVNTNGRFTIEAFPCSRIPVVPGMGMDYSCYVSIENHSSNSLDLWEQDRLPSPTGYWVVPPPKQIPAGGRAMMWLQDRPGATGSAAQIGYSSDGMPYKFGFSCPFFRDNTVTTNQTLKFRARSGPNDWGETNVVPGRDHPLQVQFMVT